MKRRHVLWIITGVLFLWAISGVVIAAYFKDPNEPMSSGTFGDMFGAVNALFSGLAFAGLIYTIAVQRQELQAQVSAIKMQTDELSLQRAAVQMQTEELALQRKAIEMQTKETARSADQLESQRELLYFQLVVAHVNELIAIKNKKISYLNYEITDRGSTTTHSGIKAITELVRRNKSSDASYYRNLNEFMNSFFYILQYIVDSELEDRLKDMVGKLIFVEVSESEVHVLYGMNQNNQHNLMLLNRFELHKKIQGDEWTLK